MHDPFQTYSPLGAFPGLTNPLSSPFQAFATNPAAAYNPLNAAQGMSSISPWGALSPFGPTSYPGIPAYGAIHPQQLQLAALQNPLLAAALQNQMQNPLLQNQIQYPLLQNQVQNPLLNPLVSSGLPQYGQPFGLQQHFHNPQTGFGLPYGQGSSPYSQFGSPYGQAPMLPPQTWAGPGGIYGGQPFAQAQMFGHAGRGVHTQGINPWLGY